MNLQATLTWPIYRPLLPQSKKCRSIWIIGPCINITKSIKRDTFAALDSDSSEQGYPVSEQVKVRLVTSHPSHHDARLWLVNFDPQYEWLFPWRASAVRMWCHVVVLDRDRLCFMNFDSFIPVDVMGLIRPQTFFFLRRSAERTRERRARERAPTPLRLAFAVINLLRFLAVRILQTYNASSVHF